MRSKQRESTEDRFERLAWPWLPTLLRTAGYLTRRPQDAEDLTQETMLKALRAMDRYKEGTDAKAWLMTILRRTWLDVLRRRRRRPSDVSLELLAEPIAPAMQTEPEAGVHDADWHDPDRLMARFDDEQVIEALQALPVDIRWTLLLVDVEQMDHEAAAAVMSVPVGTVKSRAFRGRRMLRDRLYELGRRGGWTVDG